MNSIFDITDGAKRQPVDSVTGRNLVGGTPYDFTGDTSTNTWEYFVSANPSEYLTAIDFSGALWYAGNVEANDQLNFQLFTNGTMVGSTVTRDGDAEKPAVDGTQEITTMTSILTDLGGTGITSAAVRVFLTTGAFSESDESFWTSGTLSAQSVPEPSAFLLLGLVGAVTVAFKNRHRIRWTRR